MAKGKYEYWLTEDGLLLLEGWARDGLIDKQIAHNIGITEQTLNNWKKTYPSFFESLKKGKEVVDIEVENALLKRALGYSYVEETKERIVDEGQRKRHSDGKVTLTEKEWDLVKTYFNGECCYCGTRLSKLTKDHLDPLHNGGVMSIDNIVPACLSCNSSKKDTNWLSWFQKQTFYDKDRARKITDYVSFAQMYKHKQIDEPDPELVVTKRVTKHVAPDTTAQIFWLKNRKPAEWRDKRDVEMSGNMQVNDPFDGLTTAELKKIAGINDEND